MSPQSRCPRAPGVPAFPVSSRSRCPRGWLSGAGTWRGAAVAAAVAGPPLPAAGCPRCHRPRPPHPSPPLPPPPPGVQPRGQGGWHLPGSPGTGMSCGHQPGPLGHRPRPGARSGNSTAAQGAPGAGGVSPVWGQPRAVPSTDGVPHLLHARGPGSSCPWLPARPSSTLRLCPPPTQIICLDLAEEMAVPKLESFNGCRSNALTVAQKMIEMFVRTKHKIDKSHEFALVVVNNDATWLSGFTSDPREVCSCLYDLDTVVCQSFNLDGLFNLIQQKVELPVTDNVQTIPPPFVVRTILVFGRPRCQPHFCGGEHVKVWDTPKSPLSLHDMFGFFGSLDTKGTNYKYEVALAGPALELHNCMAKLLAHPLQRPCQSHAHYGLLDGGDSPEGEAAS
uniref:BABA1 protein n=1 Tax=Junco hyemalis TaxID=40217 RepID=A0A8C5NKN4_JUNHY